MIYELFQGEEGLMTINANSEKDAWKKIRKAGIRNRSRTFHLIEIE